MTPRSGETLYLLNGAFRRMAHLAWGDPANPPVLCVHGLLRVSQDFDAIAASLADRYYVICPDLPGRGASEWLPDPMHYTPLSYMAALAHLLAAIGRPVHWVGTSLGGICAMLVASCAGAPIRSIVLNDVGPFLPAAALARIADYVGTRMEFDSLAALETYLRAIYASFGKLTDAQWAQMARNSARDLPGGRVVMHYDPAIAVPFRGGQAVDADMWALWDRITVPRLVLRGENSDLLPRETLARMQASGAEALTVADCGHAPALLDAPTIGAVRAFLDKV